MMILRRLLPVLLLATAAMQAAPALSQERARQQGEAERRAAPAAEPSSPSARRPGDIRLSDSFTLRALLGLDYDTERNFSLGEEERDGVRTIEPMLRLTGTWRPRESLLGFFEVEFPLEFEFQRGEKTITDASINLNQLYLSHDVSEELTARFGRQLFRDDREWLLDEQLDGVRLLYDWSGLELDLSATRFSATRRDLRDGDTVGVPTNNYALLAEYELFDDFRIGGYAILRDGRPDEDGQPLFLGLRSRGRLLLDGLEHWTEFATVRGRDEDGRRLEGYALDVGAIYTLDAPLQPRLILGHAWGSGERNRRSRTNRAFRQTDLQSNEARLGGIAKYKYYGEVLDPELSNLHILTAGLGLSLSENVTVDFVYHRYWQDHLSDELRNAAINLDPNEDRRNRSRDIGQEIDVILGVRLSDRVGMELAGGYFLPGRAFRIEDDNGFRRASDALFVRLEFDIRF